MAPSSSGRELVSAGATEAGKAEAAPTSASVGSRPSSVNCAREPKSSSCDEIDWSARSFYASSRRERLRPHQSKADNVDLVRT